MCLAGASLASPTCNVSNYKVTNPDCTVGIPRYSIRARAIP